jgi:hypothetical protein
MGDVSHAVPSIHPWVAICDEGRDDLPPARVRRSARPPSAASKAMLAAAKAMARLARDVLEDDELRAATRAEFEASRGPRP